MISKKKRKIYEREMFESYDAFKALIDDVAKREGVKNIEVHLRKDGRFSSLSHLIGLYLLILGDYHKAKRLLKQAIKLAPIGCDCADIKESLDKANHFISVVKK